MTNPKEYDIHVQFIQYLEVQYPNLLFWHTPNNQELSFLDRIKAIVIAKKRQKLGVKKGVPDLFFPVPQKGFHGLFIELKRKGGRLEKEQKQMIKRLEDNFFKVDVCFSLDQAINCLDDYLNLKNPSKYS